MTTAIRSHRRPKLRVIGSATAVRPARLAIEVLPTEVVEIWTFAQIDAAAEWERPVSAAFIPGIGWAVVRKKGSPEERQDIVEENDLALEEWRELRECKAARS